MYTENNDYLIDDDADPDNNFFNRLHVDSHYYTDDQFTRKCHTNAESDNFALIHYNCRSLAKHFSMIRDHLTSLDSMFDVIALSETWLNDDNGGVECACSGVYMLYFLRTLYYSDVLKHNMF